MLTIFAMPKPFEGHFGIIQRNAVTSWTLLRPKPEIILFGSEPGTAAVCKTLGLRHIPDVARNEYGTPLVSDLFRTAQRLASHHWLCYVNADILLMSDLPKAVEALPGWRGRFMAIGRRWLLDQEDELDFSQGWEERLRHRVRSTGRLDGESALDFFVFPRGLLRDVPDFAIGRIAWDAWLVWYATFVKTAVVDVTPTVMVVHQQHDFSHVPGGAKWVKSGVEARRNIELSGDWTRHFTAAHATFVLTAHGVRRAPLPRLLRARLGTWRRRLITWTRPVRHALGLRQDTLTMWRRLL